MNKKVFIFSVLLTMILAACAPAQPASDLAESAVMEQQSDGMVEEPMTDAAAEEGSQQESGPAMEEKAAEVSFSADVWPIIEKYALNAHGGKGGVFLENYDDILLQVVPGDPESSMLYKVLIGDGAPLMPPGNPLPDQMIQTIFDWIAQGAQNN